MDAKPGAARKPAFGSKKPSFAPSSSSATKPVFGLGGKSTFGKKAHVGRVAEPFEVEMVDDD